MKRTINFIKYLCLANVIMTVFIFTMWFVNGYAPVPLLSIIWGTHFLFSMYSKYRALNQLKYIDPEVLMKELEKMKNETNKENKDV